MRLRHAILSIPLFFIISTIFLSRFVYASNLNSFGGPNPFGGKIINSKALQIQILEATNFKCIVPGKTITIVPVGGYPMQYFIPAWVKSKTNTTPTAGKEIIGLYSQSKTTITCIFKGKPPTTQTVQLPTIKMYGTSK